MNGSLGTDLRLSTGTYEGNLDLWVPMKGYLGTDWRLSTGTCEGNLDLWGLHKGSWVQIGGNLRVPIKGIWIDGYL